MRGNSKSTMYQRVSTLEQRVDSLKSRGVELITKVIVSKNADGKIPDLFRRRYPIKAAKSLAEGEWWELCYKDPERNSWVATFEAMPGDGLESWRDTILPYMQQVEEQIAEREREGLGQLEEDLNKLSSEKKSGTRKYLIDGKLVSEDDELVRA